MTPHLRGVLCTDHPWRRQSKDVGLEVCWVVTLARVVGKEGLHPLHDEALKGGWQDLLLHQVPQVLLQDVHHTSHDLGTCLGCHGILLELLWGELALVESKKKSLLGVGVELLQNEVMEVRGGGWANE